jgi:hypothetical protein
MAGRRQLSYGEFPEDIQATIANEEFSDTNYLLITPSQVERTTERFCLRCRVADHQLKI